MMKYNNKSMLMMLALFVFGQESSAMNGSSFLGRFILDSIPLAGPAIDYVCLKSCIAFFSKPSLVQSTDIFGSKESQNSERGLSLAEKEKLEALFRTERLKLFFFPEGCCAEDTKEHGDLSVGMGSLGNQVVLGMNATGVALFEGGNTALKEAVARHELGHAVYRHSEKKIAVGAACDSFSALNGFCFYKQLIAEQKTMTQFLYYKMCHFFECADSQQVRMGALAIFVFLTQRIFCESIKQAYARYCERQADKYVIRTGDQACIQAARDFFALAASTSCPTNSCASTHPTDASRKKMFEKALEHKLHNDDTRVQNISTNVSPM